jgi:putative heme-binding domain-containing protein
MVRWWVIACALPVLASGAELPVCPPDWSIELVATAPQIKHPTVVCSAPDGRVFVAEDPMDIAAPRADLTLGRILCFHPSGEITVFADKLYAVFGMQYLEGRLYVLHNPKFSVFDDREGVGTNRVELIESTNPNPWALDWNDHVPANFRLAMDGFFYIAVGDKGLYGAVGRDGKRVDLHGGGILRMRPDGTELEIFCTGVRNILDVAINAEDEIFTYDNTDEMQWMGRLTHMVEAGFYGYPYDFIPRRPYTLWMMADYGGGAATGTLCYNEDALPPGYRGALWLADFGKRQILHVGVRRDGGTYRADSRKDVFSKVPDDFYPVGIGWGADAKSMYICDWQHRDTKENVVAGRLWKMTFTGESEPQARPPWYLPLAMGRNTDVSIDQLIAGLSHKSQAVRLTAQRALAKRGKEAAPKLIEMLALPRTPVQAKWHGIWALDGVPDEISNLARWGAPSVSQQAVRKLGLYRHAQARSALESLLASEELPLRFHAATALGRIANKDSIEPLLRQIDHPDLFVGYAIFTALNRIGRQHPETWERIAQELRSEFDVRRERTIYALRDTYDEQLVSVLSKLAANHEMPVHARMAALRLLSAAHRKRPEWKGEWWAYHPVKSPPPEKTVEWAGTTMVLGALRSALEDENETVRLAAVEGIRETRDSIPAAKLRDMFERETSGEMKRALVEAFGALRDSNAGLALMRSLPQAQEPLQAATARALGEIKFGPAAPALAHAAAKGSTNVRAMALEALVQIGGESGFAGLRPLAGAETLELRHDAIAAIGRLKHPAAVPLLLEAHTNSATRVAAIEALTLTPDTRAAEAYLDGLADRNASLREKCRKALGAVRTEAWPVVKSRFKNLPSRALTELQRIYNNFGPAREAGLFAITASLDGPEEYAAFAKRNYGDPEKGRKLFFDAAGVACSKCHAIKGEGGAVGPDLTTVGSQFGREVLIESILYPSKAIREGYQQVMVELKNGDSVSGAVKADSAELLTLQDTDGRLHALRKADMAERRTSELSLMPEGLHAALSLGDFADLIAYLESLKPAK